MESTRLYNVAFPMRRLDAIAAAALAAAACKAPPELCPRPPDRIAERNYTFRAVAGVSMGAMGAASVAAGHPELFDALGAMGGPLDAAYLLDYIERMHLGGFCSLSELTAALAAGKDLNDPGALDCDGPRPPLVEFEHRQSLNEWKFTRNGGTFDRSAYLDIFLDLSLAIGNPLYYNPDSPVFPPGLTRADFDREDFCANPVVVKGLYNAEYNPEGRYDAITFCDGEEEVLYCSGGTCADKPVDYCASASAGAQCEACGGVLKEAGERESENPDLFYREKGRYDPCYPHHEKVSFALAVDLNGNKKRDYHEPVIINGHERWDDVGWDGCPDAREDGGGGCLSADRSGGAADPNKDNYDALTNPAGTEGNWLREESEPYRDDGLDGVPGTGDYGEGDKKFTESPNRASAFARDFRTHFRTWSPERRGAMDIYLDGGIRDVFNLGVTTTQVHGMVNACAVGGSHFYSAFDQMPPQEGESWEPNFDPFLVDYARLPRNLFVRYGKPDANAREVRAGEGDQVGTPLQILYRFVTFFKWLSVRWDLPLGPATPTAGVGNRFEEVWRSEALGADRVYAVATPPGYDDAENAQKRYPVVYFMHGYGQEPGQIADLNIVLDALMNSGAMRDMIIVYPSGRCCFDHPTRGRSCIEYEGAERTPLKDLGYVRECARGTFYIDRRGYTGADATRYEASLLELIQRVDASYRTLAPRTVKLP
jgi:hypothetical protein